MYTLQGNTRPTRHTLPTPSPRMVQDHTYLTWSTYSNLLHSRQQSWAGSLFSWKRAPNVIHSTLADRSTGLYPVSLPGQPMKQWGQSQASVDDGYSAYWAHKHQHAIGTFNTCWWGSTHRSLTDAGGGYSLGGAGLPHTTPRPCRPTVSTFQLRAPLGLHFNQVLLTKPKCRV
jgi:hypothetical protein